MKFLLAFLLTYASTLQAGTQLSVDVTGPIDAQTRSKVLALKLQVDDEPTIINLYVDTPGGSAAVMEEFYDVLYELKSLGHTIECTINRAYSAGFFIVSLCDKRFAKPDASFMWHNAWFFYTGPMGIMYAKQVIEHMTEDQEFFDSIILETFKADPEIFEYIRDKEVFLDPATLNKISPGYIIIKE